MSITITVALVGLLATLLGVLITTTWRLAVLTTRLTRDVQHAGEHSQKLDERIKSLDGLPELHRLVANIGEATRENTRSLHSMRPQLAKLELHVQHLDQRIHSVKEMRSPWRSRPDPREE
jgi:bacterioferritin (cytochrome b1)